MLVSDVVAFVGFAIVSLLASGVLVVRVERIADRIGLTEAALGLLAALAADGPEITSSVTALIHRDGNVSIGIVIGSNLFNLAALVGLGALVAGSLPLKRPLALLEGAPACAVALLAALFLARSLSAPISLVLVLAVLVPYSVVAIIGPERLGRRLAFERYIGSALHEEEQELSEFIRPRPASSRDLLEGVLALGVVIAASAVMEQTGTSIGSREQLSALIVGGVVLAAITSIPNAVAAVYLARRRRSAALLAEASNSNTLNVLCGMAIPSVIVGRESKGPDDLLIGVAYVALSVVAYGPIVWRRGMGRAAGAVVIVGYLVFVVLAVRG